MFNTLNVRHLAAGSTRRKLSFKNVSSVVVHLLHSIKYTVDVPFSNMAAANLSQQLHNQQGLQAALAVNKPNSSTAAAATASLSEANQVQQATNPMEKQLPKKVRLIAKR